MPTRKRPISRRHRAQYGVDGPQDRIPRSGHDRFRYRGHLRHRNPLQCQRGSGRSRDEIGLNTALTDLKIESLDLAMIVFDIEDTFGIEIPYNANEEAADFKTVGSVVERVRALIAS